MADSSARDRAIADCCAMMRHHSALTCTRHQDTPEDCPDVLVTHSAQHGPGLPVRDGGSSFVVIEFCPWCGTKIGDGAGTATPDDPPLPCDFNRHGLGIWSSSDGWTVEQMPAGEVQVSLSDHRDPPGGETLHFEADLAAAIGAASRTPGEPRERQGEEDDEDLIPPHGSEPSIGVRVLTDWIELPHTGIEIAQSGADPVGIWYRRAASSPLAVPPLRGDSADSAIKRAEVAEKANEHARVRLIELLQAAKEDIARNTRLPEVLERVAAHLRPIPAYPGVARPHLVQADAPAMRKLLSRVYAREWTVSDAVDILMDWPNRSDEHPGVARLLARYEEAAAKHGPDAGVCLTISEVRSLLAGGEPE